MHVSSLIFLTCVKTKQRSLRTASYKKTQTDQFKKCPCTLTVSENDHARRATGAAGCQTPGSGMKEQQVRKVRRTGGLIPPEAYGGRRPRHLQHRSQSHQKQKVRHACVGGRSRSFGGCGRREGMASSRIPTESSEQRAGTAAGPELKDNNCLSLDPASRPWTGKRRDIPTAAENIRHHRALTDSSPAHHLGRQREVCGLHSVTAVFKLPLKLLFL